ncbi:hypothetical protein AM609_08670 [Actinomyces sp. oral taxon 414]|uniref:hypothetical protein n=1 Tax=Actinomyces sp. oral taxon 414 TaxID=712122 RepID=UPI0006AEEE3F|nr:hypothetical protein [Actinomyces sp. oral taxon 414]ALC99540.1 hypothetical protein AM609_08670 [Actinomyces sp. oral taxon 414]
MRVDWGSVRTRDGVKPDAAVLDVFVTSEDIDTVYDAYCHIEYAAFYNRDLEEAALPLTSALIEMVCSGRCTHWGLTMATDALYEISLGQTAPWEAEAGGTGVADRCRDIIRDSLPRLYQTARSVTDDYTLASFVTITGLTDPDENRWNTFTQTLLDHNPEVLTVKEIQRRRSNRAKTGGPMYEGFEWWK